MARPPTDEPAAAPDCRDARRELARPAPGPARGRALAHLAACAACRARVDQFGAAILAGHADEIPCAECLAQLDRFVTLELEGRPAGFELPLVEAHIQRCPECADAHALLQASLVAIRDDALPEPADMPAFDAAFAGGSGGRAPLPGRPRAARADVLRRGWGGLAGMRPLAARGVLAAFAVVILGLFATLIATQPALRLRVETLAPFDPDRRATAAAALDATATVAASRARDRVDPLGMPGGATPGTRVGAPTAAGGGRRASATPTASSRPSGDGAPGLSATRAARDARAKDAERTRLTATATLTPTVVPTVTLATEPPPRPVPDEPTAAPAPTDPPATAPAPPPEPPRGYPPPAEPPDEPYP